MKINTKVRYGFKALAYIAENSDNNKLVRIKEIAEEQDISTQYLEQILFKLKKEKIIEGKRGPNGGYKLSLPAKEINLYTVYKILDDEQKVIDCNETEEHKQVCRDGKCEPSCIWSQLDDAMTNILVKTSLKNFIDNDKKI